MPVFLYRHLTKSPRSGRYKVPQAQALGSTSTFAQEPALAGERPTTTVCVQLTTKGAEWFHAGR